MTSTNDGKEVKSNQTSGPKGKTFYVELYKSLDGRLSGECDLSDRTQHLCEAWRRVHSLCQHSASTTHPHLVAWLQRHTARTILQTEWQSPKSKDEHKNLEEAIDEFIEECDSATEARNGASPPWESQLRLRGEWFKKILANPWGHPVLRLLLDPRGQRPSDDEILEWLKEERGVMFVTRLRQLAASKCDDLAMSLVTCVMDRVRDTTEVLPDSEQGAHREQPAITEGTFALVLRAEAGFTVEVWELVTDIEFVLLHKADKMSTCIELAKQTPLRDGYQLVERLQSRLENSPREKKLWKNAKEVATLIAQVIIARCMVVPICAGVARTALYCCARSLARLIPKVRLPAAAATLAAPAATARHLHTLAAAYDAQCSSDMKPFVCELYVRAITAGMNELERLKLKTERESEARSAEQTLCSWFTQIGSLLSASDRIMCECTLTAFSVHPSPAMYDRIKNAPILPPVTVDDQDTKQEPTSEFGSWATDSRTYSNLVKTSETLNIKQTQHKANVLSIAILTEGEGLGLSPELCMDLAVLLSGPRLKTLSWDMDRELLLDNCRTYLERTHGGTRALTTELKYLNLDPSSYQHLPEEEDDENDVFYGIEKGYEHLVELQEQDRLSPNAIFDFEETESAYSDTDNDSPTPVRRKKKTKKPKITLDEESDPLSIVAEAKKSEKKKERPLSKERKDKNSNKEKKERKKKKKATGDSAENKERSRERRKDGSVSKEKKEGKEKKEAKEKKEGKEKKPRKKKPKEPKAQHLCEYKPGSLSSLIGMKVAKITSPDNKHMRNPEVKATGSVTDSDYDSQGKSSLASLNSEGNGPDVLFDGLFTDEYRSPEKGDPLSERRGSFPNNEVSFAHGQVAINSYKKSNKLNTLSLLKQSHFKMKPEQTASDVSSPSSPQSFTTVTDDVKKKITGLLEFRRQKNILEHAQRLAACHNFKTPPPSTTPLLNPLTPPNLNPSTPIKSPNAIIQPVYPDQQIISPKAVEVPEIPKVYINKKQIDQIKVIRDEVDVYLKSKFSKPIIQYASKETTDESPQSMSQNECLNLSTQKHDSRLTEISQQQTHHAVSVQNINQSNLSFHESYEKSLQDFLRELHETSNAGTGKCAKKTAKSTNRNARVKKEVKPVSRVTPITPNVSSKVEPTSSHCAKINNQGKQLETQLNTFARLSYMHKNKHFAEAVLNHQEYMLNRSIEEQRQAQFMCLQKSNVVISSTFNSTQKTKVDDKNIVIRKIEKPTVSQEHLRKVEKPSVSQERPRKIEKPTVSQEHLRNVEKPTVSQGHLRNVEKPTVSLEHLLNVEKPTVSQEYLRKVEKPAVSQEYLRKVEKPTVSQEHLRKVEKPAVSQEYLRKVEKPTVSQGHPLLSNLLYENTSERREGSVKNVSLQLEKKKTGCLSLHSKESSLSQKDQNDLLSLLRQQNMLNTHPAPFANTDCSKNNKIVNDPQSSKTTIANSSNCNPTVNITETVIKNHPIETSNHTYNINQNYEVLNIKKVLEATQNVTFRKVIDCKTAGISKTKTSKKGDTESSLNPYHNQFETKHNQNQFNLYSTKVDASGKDWQEVMDALLSHKTPSRGPNALDMVLKKVSDKKLRNQRIVRPNVINETSKEPKLGNETNIKQVNTVPHKPIARTHPQIVKSSIPSAVPLHSTNINLGRLQQPPKLIESIPKKQADIVQSEIDKLMKRCNQSETTKNLIKESRPRNSSPIVPSCKQISKNVKKQTVPQDIARPSCIQEEVKSKNILIHQDIIKRIPNVEKTKREPTSKKPGTTDFIQEKDPFISGISNSDYDLLEELMDDELRKEIGELSSDEDTYRVQTSSAKSTKTPSTSICSNVIKNAPLQQEKPHITHATNVPQSCRKSIIQTNQIYASCQNKPKVISDIKIVNNNLAPNQFAGKIIKQYSKDCKTASDFSNQIACPTVVHQPLNTNVISNRSFEQPSPLISGNHVSVVDPRNVIITMPQRTLQNVVLVGSELVYDPYAAIQTTGLTNVNQSSYVTFESPPNLTVFQTTQFAAPLVNPCVIGNAMTVQATSVSMLEVPLDDSPTQQNRNCSSLKSNELPKSRAEMTKFKTNLNIQSETVNQTNNVSQNLNNQDLINSQEYQQGTKRKDEVWKRFNMDSSVVKKDKDVTDVVTHDKKAEILIKPTKIKSMIINPSSKNCERNILKEVQEKQKLNDMIQPCIQKQITSDDIKKTDKELEQTVQVPKILKEPKHSVENVLTKENTQEKERLKNKRLALMNREINHRSNDPPIPLNYTPLKLNSSPSVKKTPQKEKSRISKAESDNSKSNISNNNMNTNNEKHVNDNSNKNDSIPTPRRILLRSWNVIQAKSSDSQTTKIVKKKAKGEVKRKRRPSGKVSLLVPQVEAKGKQSDIDQCKSSRSPKKPPKNILKSTATLDKESIKPPKKVPKLILKIPKPKNKKTKITVVATKKSIKKKSPKRQLIKSTNDTNCPSTTPAIDTNLNFIDVEEALVGAKIPKKPILLEDVQKSNCKEVASESRDKIFTQHVDIKPSEPLDNNNSESNIKNESQTVEPLASKPNILIQDSHTKSVSNNKPLNNNSENDTRNESLKEVALDKNKDKISNFKEKKTCDRIVEPLASKLDTLMQDSHTKSVSNNNLDSSSKTSAIDRHSKSDKSVPTDSLKVNSQKTDEYNIVIQKPESISELSINKNSEKNQNKQHSSPAVGNNEPNCSKMKLSTSSDNNSLPHKNVPRKSNVSQNTNVLDNLNKDDTLKYLKNTVSIEEMPEDNQCGNSDKKCVRIKLPNGKTFKATVYGKMHVSFESLFSNPTLKNTLLSNLNPSRRYTLNVKQVSKQLDQDPSKIVGARIEEIKVQPGGDLIETVNLLSDDEEENDHVSIQDTKIEFGGFKVLDSNKQAYEQHRDKLTKKCLVKLVRTETKKEEAVKHCENIPIVDLSNVEKITPLNEEVLVDINSVLAEKVTKIEAEKVTKIEADKVIEIDDSSNDSLNLVADLSTLPNNPTKEPNGFHISPGENDAKPEAKINELKNLLLKDLGVGESENQETVHSLSNDILHGVSSDNKNCNDVPIIKKCTVPLSRCDRLVEQYEKALVKQYEKALVEQYEKAKIIKRKCIVNLVRCDDMIIARNDVNSRDEKLLASDEFIDAGFEEDNQNETCLLSRSNSLSLLNDFMFYNQEDSVNEESPYDSYECDRSSPVMDVFETIAVFRKYSKVEKNRHDIFKNDIKPLFCSSEWSKTKRETSLESKLAKLSLITCDNVCLDTCIMSNSHEILQTEIPSLKTLTAKLFRNYSIFDSYTICGPRKTSYDNTTKDALQSSTHTLKRKLRSSEARSSGSKILKTMDNSSIVDVHKKSSNHNNDCNNGKLNTNGTNHNDGNKNEDIVINWPILECNKDVSVYTLTENDIQKVDLLMENKEINEIPSNSRSNVDDTRQSHSLLNYQLSSELTEVVGKTCNESEYSDIVFESITPIITAEQKSVIRLSDESTLIQAETAQVIVDTSDVLPMFDKAESLDDIISSVPNEGEPPELPKRIFQKPEEEDSRQNKVNVNIYTKDPVSDQLPTLKKQNIEDLRTLNSFTDCVMHSSDSEIIRQDVFDKAESFDNIISSVPNEEKPSEPPNNSYEKSEQEDSRQNKDNENVYTKDSVIEDQLPIQNKHNIEDISTLNSLTDCVTHSSDCEIIRKDVFDKAESFDNSVSSVPNEDKPSEPPKYGYEKSEQEDLRQNKNNENVYTKNSVIEDQVPKQTKHYNEDFSTFNSITERTHFDSEIIRQDVFYKAESFDNSVSSVPMPNEGEPSEPATHSFEKSEQEDSRQNKDNVIVYTIDSVNEDQLPIQNKHNIEDFSTLNSVTEITHSDSEIIRQDVFIKAESFENSVSSVPMPNEGEPPEPPTHSFENSEQEDSRHNKANKNVYTINWVNEDQLSIQNKHNIEDISTLDSDTDIKHSYSEIIRHNNGIGLNMHYDLPKSNTKSVVSNFGNEKNLTQNNAHVSSASYDQFLNKDTDIEIKNEFENNSKETVENRSTTKLFNLVTNQFFLEAVESGLNNIQHSQSNDSLDKSNKKGEHNITTKNEHCDEKLSELDMINREIDEIVELQADYDSKDQRMVVENNCSDAPCDIETNKNESSYVSLSIKNADTEKKYIDCDNNDTDLDNTEVSSEHIMDIQKSCKDISCAITNETDAGITLACKDLNVANKVTVESIKDRKDCFEKNDVDCDVNSSELDNNIIVNGGVAEVQTEFDLIGQQLVVTDDKCTVFDMSNENDDDLLLGKEFLLVNNDANNSDNVVEVQVNESELDEVVELHTESHPEEQRLLVAENNTVNDENDKHDDWDNTYESTKSLSTVELLDHGYASPNKTVKKNLSNAVEKLQSNLSVEIISEELIDYETSIEDTYIDTLKEKFGNPARKEVTLVCNGRDDLVLTGIEYEDPVVGTCFVFPIIEENEETEKVIQEIDESEFTGTNLDKRDLSDEDILEVKVPKVTYSRLKTSSNLKLKRKLDMTDVIHVGKRYRKEKQLYSRITPANLVFGKEYKGVIDYCNSLKFSFSHPFHKDVFDVQALLKNWPIKGACAYSDSLCDNDESITLFRDEDSIQSNPADVPFAEEINENYNDLETQFDTVDESNFKMGFGEGSDRVFQNLEEVGDVSAATLSDVKQPQPFLLSEEYDCKKEFDSQEKHFDDQLKKLKQYITYIQLKDKVRSFFQKTSVELAMDFGTLEKDNNFNSKSSTKQLNCLFDLCLPDFIEPSPIEAVVQVVQVGQLPVSAAAQNPVTCDPRVTQVSDASPSQCSVENSPQDDAQVSIKTEYTELTTADLTLPLVQQYAQHNQNFPVESQSASNILMSNENIPIETEVKSVVKIELEELPEVKEENRENFENNEIQSSENKNDNNVDFSFESNNPANSGNLEPESDFQNIFDSTEKQNYNEAFTQKQQNGISEKTDQIAHAMNAAGITTSQETMTSATRAHALVNILSQKLRQGAIGAAQSATNTYPKTTSINAMALQQALAQILPPPLNQTNVSDSNQQSSNSQVAPQVLHIVQGKNATGSQITLVDNSQQSVINSANATPVLHIVQNKSGTTSTSANGTATSQANSFSGLSLVDAGLQQGGNQLLHIVNTGSQKNNNATGQLLKRVNLLTNLANVQGSNEQKMVQFVCKSADGKSIQLNAPHQRSMVLRLQPIETPNVTVQATPLKSSENQDGSTNSLAGKDNSSQQEIKSRSVYEENYAKFIQNSSSKSTISEKSTSLPKFNQAFGKPVFQDGNQKTEINSNNSHLSSVNNNNDTNECQSNDNAMNLDHINQISSPPLLLRKSPQTSQSQANLVQQLKQTIAPMNIQTMHGGVIYTRQIPVNIGGGQTINLITVPSTELIDDSAQKQQSGNQTEIEQSIIKIVSQNQNTLNSDMTAEESNVPNSGSNENTQNSQPQPVLTQMRIKLPMLSKAPQMVSGARVVRPSFFQIQRNVIGGANQPVYQQLVLTAAPPLGQQTIRLPQTQTSRQIKVPTESQSSAESQMSSSTLEQLREFDMVLEQVKERSTVQPGSSTSTTFPKLHTPSTDTTDSGTSASSTSTESTQQVLYSIGNSQQLNVAYVNRKATVTTPTTSAFARSPDSSGIVDSPTSTHVQIPHTVTSETTQNETSTQQKAAKVGSRSKSRPKASSNPPSNLKFNTVPPKTSAQKPLEDEQTTQRILYILAEYKEQVENSPDKDKPAPRRRSNPPSNPGSSKRKKSSSGSRRHGARDLSPVHGEDTCRTMGSEDSSCGTSQGDCNESCLESHSPQDSPRKVVRKLTFEPETPTPQPRPQPQRNVIVADGQTITVARGTAGKPATAVLMPANYILPVSMVKGGQQIAIVTNRGPKILTVGGGEGATNALLLQRLIGPAGLKPVLARPGVRHVRLPTAALHNLQAFNLATTTTIQPPDSTASPVPAPTPPELVDTRATSSPWTDRDMQDVKPERASSPDGSEPWNLPSSGDPHDYSYEETVRADNLDRTVLDPIPDRYSPDMEAQRIFDKMFDVESKKSYMGDSHDDSPRCGYDIDASDCDDKAYHQVVQKKDGSSHRQHRLTHVSAAALRHKYAILEHELRLQKSLSEECEDLGVDSPSASELFPEAELLFAASPAHDHTQDHAHHSHTPQPTHLNQSGIPQPDMDDQIATDQLLSRNDLNDDQRDLNLGLEDVGIVTVSEDGMQATIALDQEEFARSHPNTTFHSEPTDEGEVQPFTIAGLKARHITSTIFHSNHAPATVLMTTPQTTVISQAITDNNVKYGIGNIMNSLPSGNNSNINLASVLVKDDGLTRFDNILNDSRELHLSNTASAIVHPTGNAAQVIRRVCYDEDKRDNRFLMDEPDALIAGDDAKMIAEDSSRDATLESMADVDDDRSSPERHAELFWESNSASASESRRPLDFSSDSEKCCKSPSYDTNSTDSSGVGTHMRLDSVIKEARGIERSGSAEGSSADDTHPPLRTYPPKRTYHPLEGEVERSLSGKTRAGERSPHSLEVRRRASGRGVVKRGCHCCNGSPAPPRPKKPRQRKPTMDFTTN